MALKVVMTIGGGKKIETEERTVTASTSAITVLPAEGKALSKVIVNPTPTESKRVTPKQSTQNVYPSSGKHLASLVVEGEPNAIPKNIVKGKSILGVTGSAETTDTAFGMFLDKADAPTKMKIRVGNIPDYGLEEFAVDSEYFHAVRQFEVEAGSVGTYGLANMFKNEKNRTSFIKRKIKLKVSSMGYAALDSTASYYAQNSFWISSKCTSILAERRDTLFQNCANDVVGMYCEAPSKPAGWSDYWDKIYNTENPGFTTMWGVSEEQFDAM